LGSHQKIKHCRLAKYVGETNYLKNVLA